MIAPVLAAICAAAVLGAADAGRADMSRQDDRGQTATMQQVAEGYVKLVLVNLLWKPTRFPADLRDKLQPHVSE